MDSSNLAELCTKIFDGTAKHCMAFVPVLFLLRVAYAAMTGSAEEIRATIKGTALFFILIYSFEQLLEVLFTIPEAVLEEVSVLPEIPKEEDVGAIDLKIRTIPGFVQYFLEAVIAGLYWVAAVVHALFMAIMSALAPVVFLFGCLLGIGIGIKLFFGVLVLACSWPLMWYGFNSFGDWLSTVVEDPFGRMCCDALVMLLKGIGPIGMAALSMNSGPGNAMAAGVSTWVSGLRLGQSAKNMAGSHMERLSNRGRNHTPGGTFQYNDVSRILAGLQQSQPQITRAQHKGNSAKGRGTERPSGVNRKGNQEKTASQKLSSNESRAGQMSAAQVAIGSADSVSSRTIEVQTSVDSGSSGASHGVSSASTETQQAVAASAQTLNTSQQTIRKTSASSGSERSQTPALSQTQTTAGNRSSNARKGVTASSSRSPGVASSSRASSTSSRVNTNASSSTTPSRVNLRQPTIDHANPFLSSEIDMSGYSEEAWAPYDLPPPNGPRGE